jgi:hypothetical protein
MSECVLYRPSNGTEGDLFYGRWCAGCERERAFREDERADGCAIFSETLITGVDDPEYPRQWRQDGPRGPRCTAFVAEGGDVPVGFDPSAAIGLLL